MIIIIALIIIVVISLWNHKKKATPTTVEQPKIDAEYICDDGTFRIVGTKDSFLVSKNTRFSFLVKNGQIVSFVDRDVSEERITYGGPDHGNC